MYTYKILITGDTGVGKTTLICKHLTGKFTEEYKKTTNPSTYPLVIQTNKGAIYIELLDIPGGRDYIDKDYSPMDGIIIVYEISNLKSYQELKPWVDDIKRVYPDAPIVLYGSKSDTLTHQAETNGKAIISKYDIPFYNCSSKSGNNQMEPFLHLIRKLQSDDNIHLTEYRTTDSPKYKKKESLMKLFDKTSANKV